MFTTPSYDLLEWVSQHLQLIGWPTLIIFLWKARGYIDKFISGGELSDKRLLETYSIATELKIGLDTLQNNHMSHLQDSMNKNNELLSNIDRNIAILVDRNK